MGAVINQAPELYRGIVTQVPFVDALTTMSDPSIPLTTGEYDEWGNPENESAYGISAPTARMTTLRRKPTRICW